MRTCGAFRRRDPGDRARHPRSQRAVHRPPDAAGHRHAVRQPVAGRAAAGPAYQGAVLAERGLFRRPRAGLRAAGRGDHHLGPEAHRRGQLRALPDRRPAAILPSLSAPKPASRAGLPAWSSSSLRRVVGNNSFGSILSEERGDIMANIQSEVNAAASEFGIEIVDFRVRRTDLPDANAQSIYQRMRTEREREAKEFRAQGAEVAQRIRARADRERTVLIAESKEDGADQARRGRCGRDPHLCGELRAGPGLLRLLPLDGGLQERARQGEHHTGAEPGQRLFRLLRRHFRQGFK